MGTILQAVCMQLGAWQDLGIGVMAKIQGSIPVLIAGTLIQRH